MNEKTFNRRSGVPDRLGQGLFRLRVYKRKAKPGRMARFLVKCGCCDEAVTICYDDVSLEIAGVLASRDEWRALLGRLLRKPDSAR